MASLEPVGPETLDRATVDSVSTDTPGEKASEALDSQPVDIGDTKVALIAATEYACYSPATVQTCWGVTSFKAPFYEPSVRSSVDLVAVIDKSGSMGGRKIALVRETLLFVIDQCELYSLALL